MGFWRWRDGDAGREKKRRKFPDWIRFLELETGVKTETL